MSMLLNNIDIQGTQKLQEEYVWIKNSWLGVGNVEF